jgi:hypothetical protein
MNVVWAWCLWARLGSSTSASHPSSLEPFLCQLFWASCTSGKILEHKIVSKIEIATRLAGCCCYSATESKVRRRGASWGWSRAPRSWWPWDSWIDFTDSGTVQVIISLQAILWAVILQLHSWEGRSTTIHIFSSQITALCVWIATSWRKMRFALEIFSILSQWGLAIQLAFLQLWMAEEFDLLVTSTDSGDGRWSKIMLRPSQLCS